MAPSPESVGRELERVVWYSLDNGFVDNAIFFAQRRAALQRDSADAKYLLAMAYFGGRNYLAAAATVHNAHQPESLYLYARSCLALERYNDAERALQSILATKSIGDEKNMGKHDAARRHCIPDQASVYCLLGHVYRKMNLKSQASECFHTSLRMNPLLWESYEALCQLGFFPDIDTLYRDLPSSWNAMSSSADTEMQEDHGFQPLQQSSNGIFTPDDVARNARQKPIIAGGMFNKPKPMSAFDVHVPITPTVQPGNNGPTTSKLDMRPPSTAAPSQLPSKQVAMHPTVYSQSISSSLTAPTAASRGRAATKGDPVNNFVSSTSESSRERGTSRTTKKVMGENRPRKAAPPRALKGGKDEISSRRSTRLQSTFPAPVSKPSSTFQVGADKRKMSKATGKDGMEEADEKEIKHIAKHTNTRCRCLDIEMDGEAQKQILQLLSQCAEGLSNLSKYECSKAIASFGKLPADQYNTGWVLAQVGKAYFEIVDYPAAEKVFEVLRKLEPWRIQDMEVYSTLLWHMQKQVQLSFLAHELMGMQRTSPQAWIAIGNCFSLQRNHDMALKCFQRAIQLDENFTYAYTLSGHESVSNEDFDKAHSFFQSAMRIDPRHYNAWYGLGMVSLKTGTIELAENNFARAMAINPTNAVLICCLGLVYEKLNRLPEAFRTYEMACKAAPTSALARFRKAKVLILMKHYEQSLEELLILQEIAPDEANIHFLLGKLYKHLGNRTKALQHLTWALNLDPKASHMVREAIEKLDVVEEELLSSAVIEATD